jgi:ankyrin repeat protein
MQSLSSDIIVISELVYFYHFHGFRKTNQGLTPLHAACYLGSVKILLKLLKEGGDLRLHDYHGRSVKDWAILNPAPKKRMKILEFLDKTRMFAMSGSGQDLLLKKASSKTLHR